MPRLTAEELEARKQGLGATDIVEVNGLSPYKGAGPMRVFSIKTGLTSDEVQASEAMEWGHVMEPVLAAWYERQTGVPMIDGGQIRSRQYPFMWATPDRIRKDGRLVEIKHVGPRMAYRWDEDSKHGVPIYVRAQVQVAMHFGGYQHADVVADVGGRPPAIWSLRYDNEFAVDLVEAAAAFWRLVENKTPPPLDYTESTRAYLHVMFPSAKPVAKQADLTSDELAKAYQEAMDNEEAAWREKERLAAELCLHLGDSEALVGETWQMTWKMGPYGKRVRRFTSRVK